MRKIFALFLGMVMVLPSVAEAQIKPFKAKKLKRLDARSRVRGPRSRGSSAAVGSAAEDPNFNECKRVRRRVKVTLKPEAKLMDLVGWISAITCKKFIVPKNLRAQPITIYAPKPISPYEAYKAFLSSLQAMGLTIQKVGAFYKIVEVNKAKQLPTPVYGPGQNVGTTERLVTALLYVKYADLKEVAKVLEKFKTSHGFIVQYEPTNLLIVTDTALSVKRMERILKYLDEESASSARIWVITLKYADSKDMVSLLNDVFGLSSSKARGRGTSSRAPYVPPVLKKRPRRKTSRKGAAEKESRGGGLVKVIAEERTNSIILIGDEESYARVLALVKRLDVPLAGGEEKIHIVYLENADADEMASLLSSLVGGGGYSGHRRTSRRTSKARTSRRYSGVNRANMASIFKGPVQITADPSTNSLVIVASAKDFMALKKVIKELDRPRLQVYVEVTILEVSLDRTRNLGISFHGGKPVGEGDNQSLLFGGNVTNSSVNSIIMNPLSLMGLAVGLRGPEIENAESLLGIPGISFPSFGVLLQALQRNNGVNVLSTPHILTTDNEEAEITVGENVPFQAGMTGIPSLAGTSGTTGLNFLPMMSIQRQDVALKLKITPHVNQSDFVRLEVDQEINEVKSIDPVVGPTTSKRRAKTVVVVKDQQTVVIGGLITEKMKENVTKVPLLGDIPIIGYLFKSTTKTVEKTNLLIFITPYIIRDESDLRRIFQQKLQERKEFIEKYTAFKDHDLDAVINYRHKHGLVEEINRVAREAEEEIAMKEKAMKESKELDLTGPVDMDGGSQPSDGSDKDGANGDESERSAAPSERSTKNEGKDGAQGGAK